MELNNGEKQLLAIVYGLSQNSFPTSREMIRRGGEEFFKQNLVDLEDAFVTLQVKELLFLDGESYLLREGSGELAGQFLEDFMQDGFSSGLLRYAESGAYGEFCRELYGIDLGQLNLLNRGQLERLVELLPRGEDRIILDLGCGLGRLTEYLCDQSGATLIGLDHAVDAINAAAARAAGKGDRLHFLAQDFEDLELPEESFDTILAVDSLSFARDQERLLNSLKPLLKPEGRLLLFYSGRSESGAEGTELAPLLKAAGFSYRAEDFSAEEFIFWNNVVEIGEPLRNRFEQEGNLELIDRLIGEARVNLKQNGVHRVRYLYECKVLR